MSEERQQPQTLETLRAVRGAPEQNLPAVSPGFGSLQAYELLYRQAKTLSSSTLVPTAYRQLIVKTNYKGEIVSQTENANAIPNTMIALNMATRMNADPVMVMQNLIIVEGRPSWSAQWVIAQINQCGRFEPLRFDLIDLGKRKITMEYTEWVDGERGGRDKKRMTRDVEIDDSQCIAWTVQRGVKVPVGVVTLKDAIDAKLPVIKGPRVSVGMAVQEGWYTKTGSKWQTMPELMQQYRAGAFFGRLHAPELLMGIPTEDEVHDMGTLVQNADGSYGMPESSTPTVDELRQSAAAHADAAQETRGESGEGRTAQATESASASPQSTAAPTGEADPKPKATSTAAPAAAADDNLFGNTD